MNNGTKDTATDHIKHCKHCRGVFIVSRKWHIYCSATCRVKDWKSRNDPTDRIIALEKIVARIQGKMGIK